MPFLAADAAGHDRAPIAAAAQRVPIDGAPADRAVLPASSADFPVHRQGHPAVTGTTAPAPGCARRRGVPFRSQNRSPCWLAGSSRGRHAVPDMGPTVGCDRIVDRLEAGSAGIRSVGARRLGRSGVPSLWTPWPVSELRPFVEFPVQSELFVRESGGLHDDLPDLGGVKVRIGLGHHSADLGDGVVGFRVGTARLAAEFAVPVAEPGVVLAAALHATVAVTPDLGRAGVQMRFPSLLIEVRGVVWSQWAQRGRRTFLAPWASRWLMS